MAAIKDITKKALDNTYFRQVLDTGKYTQVVIMSIPKGGEIGEEVHPDTDQVLFCVAGEGKTVLDGAEEPFLKNDLVLVKAGTKHNFINTGQDDLKIITSYSPPHHPEGTIHKSKKEADKAEY
ncbi:MAG: cupin 2 conserved barrel protein [uncultured bacterium]|uniref:Mannose-6-phosphate isomerase n=4 Tax=Candidatus Daviesiibacteriota TaxID=1752718 RepID=A0A0G0H8Y0_9BACT|nr:MAG: cupin 2 conserved barrel protein [uncultured bacterium]KKQ08554.1 MAG: Mannose-6-phosphate isomerase [Candidatus Daviesbacteria bacterium GW2011_GWB1_36_5]KKQ13909.1 MAG: Mannose-6-phosphate isomerase [Candidatus Daviesbacteria bacterium GW2011_GWA1_36_8]OGE17108.1 MAG: hypothetical protein A2858_00180 [Candidatus Daviesbacteria bacterium RIFCSPHIGHO2_01_FULL_36_37]OGE31258.1 MAG: hypothetical protein A3C99_01265 [Candidatus Daviesbacteria bacterium RIFCSPHIGHO2_02_FULL_37_9]OGE35889.1